MEKLIEILEDINPDIDYRGRDGLMDQGILTSFEMVLLVTGIKEAFGVTVPAHKITPEHFNSVEAMERLIAELEEGF